MRSHFARRARYCGAFPIHAYDDAAQPHRLSQAGNEIAHAARRFRPARCNGDHPQAGDGAPGLRRVSAAQVDRALRRAMLTNVRPRRLSSNINRRKKGLFDG